MKVILKSIVSASIAILAASAYAGPLENLQPGHWYEVPNSALQSVFPNPTPPGNSGPESVMDAWSGGAFDTLRDRLIVWGGGHADYSGNEVYVFDVETLQWSRLTDPSSDVGGNESSGLYPDGKPRSAHTNNYIQYAASVDRFVSVGLGFSYIQSFSTPFLHAFNFNNLSWNSNLQSVPSGSGSIPDSVTAYDSSTGLIWRQGGGNGEFRSYDPVNDSWSSAYGSGPYLEFYNTAAIDPGRHIMVSTGPDNSVLVWNLNSPSSPTAVSTSGDKFIESKQAPGFDFELAGNRFIGWGGGTSVYALDPTNWNWTEISAASGNSANPGSPNSRGTFGRFRYIPSKNLFILVNRTDENVFFYRSDSDSSAGAPFVSLTVNPTSVALGGVATITWSSSGADSCVASGAWTGNKSTSGGSEISANLQITSTFSLECTNSTASTVRSAIVTVDAGADNTPPSVPSGLDQTIDASGSVSLTWVASTDGGSGVAGFRVYRDGVLLGETTETSYVDVLVASGKTYGYTVRAFDNAGNESSNSSVVDVTTSIREGVVARINCGGDDYFDSENRLWSADTGFNVGSATSDSGSVGYTLEDELFQSQRWDPETQPELEYRFPVNNGRYIVNLYFNEFYSGAFSEGARTQDVKIEGLIVESGLDVFSEAGARTALLKSYAVDVVDRELNIQFVHGNENTMVSAIEILPTGHLPMTLRKAD